MGNWSDVHPDLLVFKAKWINKLEDFVRFGAVCKSWHAVAVKENFRGISLREHIPYLMLAVEGDDNPEREFYSLLEKEIVTKVSLPRLKGKKCIEHLGWLLSLGSKGDMCLLNPLTGVEIEMPHYLTLYPNANPDDIDTIPFIFVHKMVLSSRPDKSSDFVVMILQGGVHRLAFWRPGDDKWNMVEEHFGRPYCDVTYCNGQFYAIDGLGLIVFFDPAGPNPRKRQILAHLTNNELARSVNLDKISGPRYAFNNTDINELVDEMLMYIVEYKGALLVIARKAREHYEDGEVFYDTSHFNLYKVDMLSGRWEKIYGLGSKAAFVGHSVTTLVETSKFHEFKANHIYYTIDPWHLIDLVLLDDPETSCQDIGVYNLETEAIESFYHGDEHKLFSEISPAVWVTPSFT